MAPFDLDASDKADALHAAGKFDQVRELLSEAQYHADADDNVELLWRLSRSCFDQQEASNNNKEKEKLVRDGLDLAERVIKLDEKHFAGHKWRAIMLSELGNYTSLKEKISDSFLIREEFELALQSQPNDPTTLLALGKWCQAVASVGWIQRKVATTLFAKLPRATYEDAIDFYKRAYDTAPGKRSAFALGECYHALKQKSKCKEWMQKCVDCPSASAVEQELDKQAKTFL